ncbi:MAG: hypothetical protein ACYC2G_15145 [Gemmatimonadaceae bacterium]
MSLLSLASPGPSGSPHPARASAGRMLARRMTGPTGGTVARTIAGLVLVVAAIGVVPASAAAQFATGLTPPPRPAAEDEVAAAESVAVAARDSVVREQRLDMKAWVDSAASSLQAGAAVATPIPVSPDDTTAKLPPASPAPVTRDTTATTLPAPVRPPADSATPTRRPPPSPGFRPGAPAPDTATPLPLLAVVGAGLLGSGLTMLRRKG